MKKKFGFLTLLVVLLMGCTISEAAACTYRWYASYYSKTVKCSLSSSEHLQYYYANDDDVTHTIKTQHKYGYATTWEEEIEDCYFSYDSSKGIKPTCYHTGTKWYVCSDCLNFYTVTLPMKDHEMVYYPGYAPNCTETGLKPYWYCNWCTYDEGYEVIPALGHVEVNANDAIPATRTTPGLTASTVCSTCGETLQPQAVIPASPVLTVKAIDATKIKLTWTDQDCAGYIIKRSTKKNGSYTEIATLDGNEFSYTDVEVEFGKTYYYTISAYNNYHAGKATSPASLKQEGACALIKVTGVKAQSNGYNAAKITWNCQPGADAYRIYMRTGKKTAAAKLVATVKNPNDKVTLSRVVKKLESGTTYYFEVRAFHGGKEGPASSKVSVKPVPAAAKGLKAVAKVGRKVVLSWTKVSGATGYEIYRSSKETSGYKKIDDVITNKVTLTAQTANRTFFYKIRPYRTVNGKKIYGPYCAPVSCLVKK